MSIIFEGPKVPDRGYTVRASEADGSGDALVEIFREGELVKQFTFPAYKVWNIAAHFSDIVDSEIAQNTHGYELAAWTGPSGGRR